MTDPTQRRIDAENTEAEHNTRRASERGWPVTTEHGETIIRRSIFEGQTRILIAADGRRYRAQSGRWVLDGIDAPDGVDPEPAPEHEIPSEPEPEKAADPLAEQVADLTTEAPAPEPEPEPTED